MAAIGKMRFSSYIRRVTSGQNYSTKIIYIVSQHQTSKRMLLKRGMGNGKFPLSKFPISKIGPQCEVFWGFSQIKVDALWINQRNCSFTVNIYTFCCVVGTLHTRLYGRLVLGELFVLDVLIVLDVLFVLEE